MVACGLAKLQTLTGHEDRVWCVAWRPGQSAQILSCGEDRHLRLWGPAKGTQPEDVGAWQLLSESDATGHHSRTLRCVAWHPWGNVVAVASFDAATSLWTCEEGEAGARRGLEFVNLVTGHENEVKSAAFSASGSFFATCSRDKSVWIYEVEESHEYEVLAVLQGHTQDVKMVKWHPTQDVLFSCSYDNTVKIWGPDGDDWSCMQTLEDHTSTVWGLCFDLSGNRFMTCSDDTSLKLWSTERGTAKEPPPPAADLHRAMFVRPLFGGPLAPGPASPGEKPAEPEPKATGPWRCAATLQGHHQRPVYSVDWLLWGEGPQTVATACGDNNIRVFQSDPTTATCGNDALGSWTCLSNLEAHDGDANVVAWCRQPVGTGVKLLASGGDDGQVCIWRFDEVV